MRGGTITASEKAFLKRVGARIRKLRQQRNWTLEDTEENGWPDWTHMQQIETGKNITVITFRRVAKLYQISPAELWDDL